MQYSREPCRGVIAALLGGPLLKSRGPARATYPHLEAHFLNQRAYRQLDRHCVTVQLAVAPLRLGRLHERCRLMAGAARLYFRDCGRVSRNPEIGAMLTAETLAVWETLQSLSRAVYQDAARTQQLPRVSLAPLSTALVTIFWALKLHTVTLPQRRGPQGIVGAHLALDL